MCKSTVQKFLEFGSPLSRQARELAVKKKHLLNNTLFSTAMVFKKTILILGVSGSFAIYLHKNKTRPRLSVYEFNTNQGVNFDIQSTALD